MCCRSLSFYTRLREQAEEPGSERRLRIGDLPAEEAAGNTTGRCSGNNGTRSD